jgi:hypothetical protein
VFLGEREFDGGKIKLRKGFWSGTGQIKGESRREKRMEKKGQNRRRENPVHSARSPLT